MISIIISSVNNQYLLQLKESIKNTIGVPYEIILINGKDNKLGLCNAYNAGAEKSNFSYLCFIHEDVIFHTQNWGSILMGYFTDDVGLIGLAGNICKTKMTSTWPQSYLKNTITRRCNLIQNFKRTNTPPEKNYVNPHNEVAASVVTLDGFFLATKKEIWQQFQFDEKLLNGYHGYDLDFCMSIGTKFRIIVAFGILTTHFSEGNCDINCMEALYKVHNKWKHSLPRIVPGYQWDENFNYEQSFIKFTQNVKTLVKFGMTYSFIFKRFFQMLLLLDFKKYTFKYYLSVIRSLLNFTRYYLSFHYKFIK